MGRRENPIGQCSRSLHALATWLRAGRETAGLTYDQVASRTEYSADTLARAASGRSVPQNLDVVTAYAKACGLSVKEAERLWKQARRDEARAQGVLSGHRGGVHISVVKDFADLHSAIVDLYHDDGSPPLRSLDARLGGLGRLPRSTVGRVLKGRSTPSRTFVAAFAEAFEVRKADLPEWTKAWDRADADRRSTRVRSKRSGRHGLSPHLIRHDRLTPRDLQVLMSEMEASARHEPALKLLVHIPQPEDAEAHASARMTRELLVDQAQRRGDLACPQCRRPSLGYHGSKGWTSQLCADCAPSETAGGAGDTPTLSLRLPATAERKPLPQRIARSWPAPTGPSLTPSQTADSLATVTDPPATPAAAPEIPPDCDCASCQGNLGIPSRKPSAGTPTTRIRINIPGSRPILPIVVREPAAGQPTPAGTEPQSDPWQAS
ncbi:helix-turn-helix domain-containing protein [Streptomyces sp. 4N124]|uniref:helix-turn-helix domain-containing protein n=1 Tax=Streptomyces sp. 4N124 TaxID=3457420 RepID=UPI003FD2ABC0